MTKPKPAPSSRGGKAQTVSKAPARPPMNLRIVSLSLSPGQVHLSLDAGEQAFSLDGLRDLVEALRPIAARLASP